MAIRIGTRIKVQTIRYYAEIYDNHVINSYVMTSYMSRDFYIRKCVENFVSKAPTISEIVGKIFKNAENI